MRPIRNHGAAREPEVVRQWVYLGLDDAEGWFARRPVGVAVDRICVVAADSVTRAEPRAPRMSEGGYTNAPTTSKQGVTPSPARMVRQRVPGGRMRVGRIHSGSTTRDPVDRRCKVTAWGQHHRAGAGYLGSKVPTGRGTFVSVAPEGQLQRSGHDSGEEDVRHDRGRTHRLSAATRVHARSCPAARYSPRGPKPPRRARPDGEMT